MRRIMLVDDEVNVLNALKRCLVRHLAPDECAVQTYASPTEALLAARSQAYDVVISDYRMPEMDGVAFLRELKSMQPDTIRLILSAATDQAGLIQAINQAEILRFLAKPWQDEELLAVVNEALARREHLLEERRLADESRLRENAISPQEWEKRRLEAEEPGITRVNWGPDGSVLLDGED